MKRALMLVMLLMLTAAPVIAQTDNDPRLLAEINTALLALDDLERYTVTWEIQIIEWIALWDDDVLTNGIDRDVQITYTDHFLAGADHFTFQRRAEVIEQRLHENQTVTYTTEIRIVDGVIYVRVDVLEGEMSGGFPGEWAVWRYPDQWSALEDLLPHTYFVAVELNSPLPFFDLSPDAITALTTNLTSVQESFWPWGDVNARQLALYDLGPDVLAVIATRPSLDTNDPFVHALLDYPGDTPQQLFHLYFDREHPDTLIGMEDIRVIEADHLPRNAFEDGAPDSLWLYMHNQRVSKIEFRDLDVAFDPIDAPVIE